MLDDTDLPTREETTNSLVTGAAEFSAPTGLYAQDCDLAPLLDHTDPAIIAAARRFGPAALGVMDYATSPDTAERLWTLSAQLTRTSPCALRVMVR